jgi:hypothetical protein
MPIRASSRSSALAFSELPFELANQDGKRLRMTLLVLDHDGIDRPVHTGDRTRRQLVLKHRSLSNECQTIAIFHERLHLAWV